MVRRRLLSLALSAPLLAVAPPAHAAGSDAAWVPTAAEAAAGTAAALPAAASTARSPEADFDGDDVPDVVVGAPGDVAGRVAGSGGFTVLYGSGKDAYFTQASAGVYGEAEADDGFGASFAVGDFDADGYDDLAVGAPGEDLGRVRDAGAITVFEGSARGLRPGRGFSQSSTGVYGTSEAGDAWGLALAAGDVDGDGDADLAVGAPGEGIGAARDAGAVTVLLGGGSGLSAAASRGLSQARADVAGVAEAGDGFGAALAVGDTDRDARADLVVGVPGESGEVTGEVTGEGAVEVLYSARGERASLVGGASLGAAGALGSALAIGDFDDDGYADVAAGAPEAVVNGAAASGAVAVLDGAADGIGDGAGRTGGGRRVWTQASADVAGAAEAGDLFGSALAAGDLTGDGRDELVVGTVGEDVDARADAGGVVVLRSGTDGLTGAGSRFLSQDSAGVEGTAEAGDGFGAALAVADRALGVGVPGEEVHRQPDAGALNVFVGGASGFSGGDFFDQELLGRSSSRAGEAFGAAVTG